MSFCALPASPICARANVATARVSPPAGQAEGFRRFLTSSVGEAMRSITYKPGRRLLLETELHHSVVICRRHSLLPDVARDLDSAEGVLGASHDDNRRGSGGFPAAQEKLATHASLIARMKATRKSTV